MISKTVAAVAVSSLGLLGFASTLPIVQEDEATLHDLEGCKVAVPPQAVSPGSEYTMPLYYGMAAMTVPGAATFEVRFFVPRPTAVFVGDHAADAKKLDLKNGHVHTLRFTYTEASETLSFALEDGAGNSITVANYPYFGKFDDSKPVIQPLVEEVDTGIVNKEKLRLTIGFKGLRSAFSLWDQ
jgi:hypothetical protein